MLWYKRTSIERKISRLVICTCRLLFTLNWGYFTMTQHKQCKSKKKTAIVLNMLLNKHILDHAVCTWVPAGGKPVDNLSLLTVDDNTDSWAKLFQASFDEPSYQGGCGSGAGGFGRIRIREFCKARIRNRVLLHWSKIFLESISMYFWT